MGSRKVSWSLRHRKGIRMIHYTRACPCSANAWSIKIPPGLPLTSRKSHLLKSINCKRSMQLAEAKLQLLEFDLLKMVLRFLMRFIHWSSEIKDNLSYFIYIVRELPSQIISANQHLLYFAMNRHSELVVLWHILI